MLLVLATCASVHAQFLSITPVKPRTVRAVDSTYLSVLEYLDKGDLRNYRNFLLHFKPTEWERKTVVCNKLDFLIDGYDPEWTQADSTKVKDHLLAEFLSVFFLKNIQRHSKVASEASWIRRIDYWTRVYPYSGIPDLGENRKQQIRYDSILRKGSLFKKIGTTLHDQDVGLAGHWVRYDYPYDTGVFIANCMAQRMIETGDTTHFDFIVQHCSKGMFDKVFQLYAPRNKSQGMEVINEPLRQRLTKLTDYNSFEDLYPLMQEQIAVHIGGTRAGAIISSKAVNDLKEKIEEKEAQIAMLVQFNQAAGIACYVLVVMAFFSGIYWWYSRRKFLRRKKENEEKVKKLEQELAEMDEQIQFNTHATQVIRDSITVFSRPEFRKG